MLLKQVDSVRTSGEMTVDTQTLIWPFYLVAWAGVAASAMLILARIWLLISNPVNLPSKKSVAEEAAENVRDAT
jgi:hypothetical protein